MQKQERGGFTLIELLVVLGIIAVLSVVVILTLNPADLLRQSRDSQRLAELDTLNKAVSLYNLDVSGSLGLSSTTYISIPDPTATSTAGDQCQGLSLPALPVGSSYHCAASSTYRNIDGTGWVPLNFTKMSMGSPFSELPRDPINQVSSGLYYTYNVGSWEFSATVESKKYIAAATSDGGLYSGEYEVGSELNLLPIDRSTASSSSPLSISNVASSNVTTSTATITWSTNLAADSKVNYGLTSGYGSSVSNASQVTSHSLNLTSLSTSTTYHYQVVSVASSTTATSSDATFTTASGPDTTPPTPNPMTFASAPSAASTSSITMTATTGSDATTPVLYNFGFTACASNGGTGGTSSGFQTATTYTDTGLQVNQCYAFTVQGEDSAAPNNTGTVSASSSAYTLANVPGAPTISSPSTSTLTFTNSANGNPSATPVTNFAVQVTSADANWNNFWVTATGASSTSATWLTNAQLTNLVVKNLQSSTTYTFAAEARNQDNIATALGPTSSGTTSAGSTSHTFTKAQLGVHNTASSGNTITCTLGANPALGDLVVVGLLWYNGTNASTTITSVKDASNNSYTVTPHSPSSNFGTVAGATYIAYLANAPSTANKAITVTFGAATTAGDMYCDDFTVTGSGSVTLDSDIASSGTGTSINYPTITVSGSNDLLYSVAADSNSITAVNSPWSAGGNATPPTTFGSAAAYDPSASANTAANMTSLGSGDNIDITGASFK